MPEPEFWLAEMVQKNRTAFLTRLKQVYCDMLDYSCIFFALTGVQLRRWSALATQPPRGTWCDSEKIKNIILHSLFSALDTRATPNQWLNTVFGNCCDVHKVVILVRFSVTAVKEVWRLHTTAWHSFSKNKHQQPYKHLTGTGGKTSNSAFVDKVSAYDVFDPEKWPCSR